MISNKSFSPDDMLNLVDQFVSQVDKKPENQKLIILGWLMSKGLADVHIVQEEVDESVFKHIKPKAQA
jgi:hypothetical protein